MGGRRPIRFDVLEVDSYRHRLELPERDDRLRSQFDLGRRRVAST